MGAKRGQKLKDFSPRFPQTIQSQTYKGHGNGANLFPRNDTN